MNIPRPLNSLVTLAVVAGIAACASTPRDVPELDQARSALNAVAQDPLAQSAAAITLQKGQKALADAQGALDSHRPVTIVQHFAYLAQRDAETAEAQIGEAHARATIDQATAERSRIIAEARGRAARREAEQARDQADQARAQAQSAEQRAAQLQAEMAQLQAHRTDRGYVLSLGDVLFDTGKAGLKPGAEAALARLATFLASHPDERVEIDGNTDNTGSAELNQQLSQARADAVRDALLQQGVADSRIVTRGLGESMPVATNATPAGRQQNRRVDVVFIHANDNALSGTPGGLPGAGTTPATGMIGPQGGTNASAAIDSGPQ
jgi:outer membrane protein OmpA-like peptidoglycan-associated protein